MPSVLKKRALMQKAGIEKGNVCRFFSLLMTFSLLTQITVGALISAIVDDKRRKLHHSAIDFAIRDGGITF